MDPVNTLFRLDAVISDLDLVQEWIDHARIAAPTNKHVQAELDRQQNEINIKRTLVAILMFDISSRN